MQAYTASPACGTSRYSTITGKYPSRAASSRALAALADKSPHSVSIPTTKLLDFEINDCSKNENIAAQFQSKWLQYTAMIGKCLSPGFLKCANVKCNMHGFHLLKKSAHLSIILGKWHLSNIANDAYTYADAVETHEAIEFINTEAQTVSTSLSLSLSLFIHQ